MPELKNCLLELFSSYGEAEASDLTLNTTYKMQGEREICFGFLMLAIHNFNATGCGWGAGGGGGVRWTLKGYAARACLVNKCFAKEAPAE